MIKNITKQILILTIFLSLNAAEPFAQTRISFANGQTSKTISRIIPESSDDFFEWVFVARGKAGQTMTATVKSRTGKVHFTAAGKSAVCPLDETDDCHIALINDGKATRFWMTVTIR